ncbi:NHL repeat-containing protein 2-like [Hydractinia symbiolongicarpus]|uniref:NHL repeat-containing protein 2-like n=1 Tax=Hydractinia symbiolongicarpus TaxID=13093 RepID=UPI00254D98CD|nr:NHL repeat-containing protein 2-like [Hydractinia symbiolongicarpus]
MVFLLAVFSLVNTSLALPGIVETIAGGGLPHKGKKTDCNDLGNSKDGQGEEARFNYPWGIAYDHYNHAVYVADCGCLDSEHSTDKIRKVDLKTRKVTTIAGSTQGFANGFGKEAHFKHIAGITLDPEMEMLYIADSGNHRIRVLYLANNKVDTIAGLSTPGLVDQSTVSSLFYNPQSVAVFRTQDGKRLLYVADTDNHAIRVIHLNTDSSGYVKTLAGGTKGFKDGVKLQAQFFHPVDIAIDGVGIYMYISDHFNHAIRRLELATGEVMTLTEKGFSTGVGWDGNPSHVTFHYPEGLVYDPDHHILYVCEFENHDVRVVTTEGLVKTLAGEFKGKKNGVGKVARFYHPSGLSFDRKRRKLYVSDQYNHLIRSITGIGSKQKYASVPDKKNLTRIYGGHKPPSNPWLFLVTLGVALMLFGALVLRPCFRLCFKFINDKSCSVVNGK